MEHNLGLTCDPVAGQVQVPCIERNAIAAVKAVNAARMALRRTSEPRVCLDKVIRDHVRNRQRHERQVPGNLPRWSGDEDCCLRLTCWPATRRRVGPSSLHNSFCYINKILVI